MRNVQNRCHSVRSWTTFTTWLYQSTPRYLAGHVQHAKSMTTSIGKAKKPKQTCHHFQINANFAYLSVSRVSWANRPNAYLRQGINHHTQKGVSTETQQCLIHCYVPSKDWVNRTLLLKARSHCSTANNGWWARTREKGKRVISPVASKCTWPEIQATNRTIKKRVRRITCPSTEVA